MTGGRLWKFSNTDERFADVIKIWHGFALSSASLVSLWSLRNLSAPILIPKLCWALIAWVEQALCWRLLTYYRTEASMTLAEPAKLQLCSGIHVCCEHSCVALCSRVGELPFGWHMRVPRCKCRGTFFGVPINEDDNILGYMRGTQFTLQGLGY